MKKLIELYRQLAWEKKIIYVGALLSLLPILATALWPTTAPTEPLTPAHRAADVDTFIPKGFVLVPIDVQNYEALDSILGQFGYVDLFQSSNPENPRAHLVARNVRLLRAPQNPSHFAILVSETQASQVLRFGSSFSVIVRGHSPAGTEFVKAQRKIVYEQD